jgi:zinc protease
MIARVNVRVLLLVALLTLISFLGVTQQAAQTQGPAATQTQQMPVDPQITMGKFPNGLRYYIRNNKKPEKRAELRLVVNVGSILEDDDQQGLAHFVEHMAFNGTKNFPKQELVSFIESMGMRFGADLNAYTSFDETVYTLQVPTDKPETLDRSLQILEDWAHNVSFEPAEIEKERSVVMEEWRLGRGAGRRTAEKIFPVMFKGSRYANRIPIGLPDIIQNGKAERLKQFYTDWYRPDLMAVIVVGDFDKAAVEKMVTAHFASIPAPKNPKPREIYTIPDRGADTGYAISTDKETTTARVEIDTLLPARDQGSLATYRQQMVDSLFSGMLSARFAEMAQKPDAPFLFAGAGRGPFPGRTKESATLVAVVKEDGIERGLDAIVSEAQRVARFGFTETELARQRQSILVSYERGAIEKENRLSGSRADEYVRNFLTNESLPTADDEYELHKRYLPEIGLAEINKLATDWFVNNNRLVIATAPAKEGLVIPNQAKLAAVIDAVKNKELKPYVDSVATTVLLDSLPTGGTVVKTSAIEAAGITEWTLSNGVRVVLKPTTFRADEILFRATSPGGTSVVSDADFIPASTASGLVAAGGVGKFSAIELRKVLTGKVASANPFIGELEEGLNGSSSRRDLETMFQLIYLRFTQPRADVNAFKVQSSQAKTLMMNQSVVPEYAFFEMLNNTRFQGHLRRRLDTVATVDEWNLDKSLAFYKDRFSDASDFTFFFVGSFDLPTIKPLIEKYLGGLPSTNRKEKWKDVGVKTPTGVVEKTVEKGSEPKSQVAIVFSGPFQFDQPHRAAMRAMTEILQTRLLEIIREELGGTYGITVNPGYQKFPRPEYSISIQFGCAPDRVDSLVKRVFEEIEKYKVSGPTEKQLTDEKETLLREFETNSKLNSYLLTQLTVRYQVGEDPAGLWNVPDLYRKLDSVTIQQFAKDYLNRSRYVKVVLYPEKKSTQ